MLKDRPSTWFTLTLALFHQGRGELVTISKLIRVYFHPHPSPLPSRERGILSHRHAIPKKDFEIVS